ncbi:hypothetical protein [Roseomonas marmotae]|uniref:Nucleotide-diphospho-sugar transferase domain-containing protein n=1 Tax=Roseomonas marmotae TaxID=2768161 RepID=A0ABS3KBI6_9PROT|nr:hypothetical protein [Roseomonas marmotae]MBO1074836.1 hypothetical protein [Roseomonas marmotae]QTI80658.1 hypothetical protein IAI58_08010 [Roseomonas marmotae]
MLLLKPEQDIVLGQSADPKRYFPMLRSTSRINREFCRRQDILYLCHYGVVRGFHPWHASYNRVFTLNQLLDLGFTGWYLHLDADAWVHDTGFNLRDYLAGIADKSLVFAPGATDRVWDVNNGVFLANLAHPDTQEVLRTWKQEIEAISPERMRRATDWAQIPEDQQLLHTVLRRDEFRLCAHLHHEHFSFMNGPEASFIRQLLRSHQRDPVKRLDTIQLQVETAMAAQGLPAEEPVTTFCNLARALDLPLPLDAAGIRAIMADKASLAAFLRQALGEDDTPSIPAA